MSGCQRHKGNFSPPPSTGHHIPSSPSTIPSSFSPFIFSSTSFSNTDLFTLNFLSFSYHQATYTHPNQTLLGLYASHHASRRHSASASTYILHKLTALKSQQLQQRTRLVCAPINHDVQISHLRCASASRSFHHAPCHDILQRHSRRYTKSDINITKSAAHRPPTHNPADIEQTSPKHRHRNQTRNIISSVVVMLYNASYTTYDFPASSSRPALLASHPPQVSKHQAK